MTTGIKMFLEAAAFSEKAAAKAYEAMEKRAIKKNLEGAAKLLGTLSKSEMMHAGMIQKCLSEEKK